MFLSVNLQPAGRKLPLPSLSIHRSLNGHIGEFLAVSWITNNYWEGCTKCQWSFYPARHACETLLRWIHRTSTNAYLKNKNYDFWSTGDPRGEHLSEIGVFRPNQSCYTWIVPIGHPSNPSLPLPPLGLYLPPPPNPPYPAPLGSYLPPPHPLSPPPSCIT